MKCYLAITLPLTLEENGAAAENQPNNAKAVNRCSLQMVCVLNDLNLCSLAPSPCPEGYPGVEERRTKSAWYTLFAHVRNYSKGHMAELGVCTNMTINGSRE